MTTHYNNRKLLFLVDLVFITIGLLFYLLQPPGITKVYQLFIVIWILVAIIIHLILDYSFGNRDILSLDKLFIFAYLIFHFDYIILYIIGLYPFQHQVIPYPNFGNITTIFISFCLLMFIIGYDFTMVVNSNKFSDQNIIKKEPYQYGNMLLWGKSLILIGFILILNFVSSIGINSLINRAYGFNLFYSGEFNTISFTGGKSLLAVGILFLLYDVIKYPKKSKIDNVINIFLTFLVILYTLFVLVFFSVRGWILLDVILPMLLFYYYLRKKISIKYLLLLVILFFLFSIVIEFSRTVQNRTLETMFTEFQQESSSQKGVVNYLSLQWRTYKNVNETIMIIDKEKQFFGGTTFIGDILSGIPLFGKYLVRGWYEEPSKWLARLVEPWFYENNEGIGFSLPAEAYINFGFFGSLVFFYFLGNICSIIYKKYLLNREALLSIMTYTVFSTNLLFSIRQTVSSISRPLIYLLILFLIVFVLSQIKKRTVNKLTYIRKFS
jgi:oligosaccharide repeat unit polymerase